MARSHTADKPTPRAKPSRKTEIRGAIFGHIRGIPVGRRWENRKAMSASCMHPPIVAGIYGRKAVGAFSVVLGGWFPDEDHGDTFTYIGSGGREPGVRFGPQTCDQDFNNNLNEALRMSTRRKLPVRVIRGHKLKSPFAPQTGFRYDGLYTVSNPRVEKGPSGFQVCKFDFTRCKDQDALPEGEGIPEMFRTDMDVRREQWQEIHRQRAREARSSSRPGSSTSRSSPSLVGDSRQTPISISDDDEENIEEEDQEDIFGDIEDVEEEMQPVQELLDHMKKPCRPEERKTRAKALLPVGRHVNEVLARKKELGSDEAGRDYKWWYDALWSYVACAMPTPNVPSPEQTESWYNKWEEKAQQLRLKKNQA